MNCCAIIRVSKIRHTCRAVPVGVLLVRRGLYFMKGEVIMRRYRPLAGKRFNPIGSIARSIITIALFCFLTGCGQMAVFAPDADSAMESMEAVAEEASVSVEASSPERDTESGEGYFEDFEEPMDTSLPGEGMETAGSGQDIIDILEYIQARSADSSVVPITESTVAPTAEPTAEPSQAPSETSAPAETQAPHDTDHNGIETGIPSLVISKDTIAESAGYKLFGFRTDAYAGAGLDGTVLPFELYYGFHVSTQDSTVTYRAYEHYDQDIAPVRTVIQSKETERWEDLEVASYDADYSFDLANQDNGLFTLTVWFDNDTKVVMPLYVNDGMVYAVYAVTGTEEAVRACIAKPDDIRALAEANNVTPEKSLSVDKEDIAYPIVDRPNRRCDTDLWRALAHDIVPDDTLPDSVKVVMVHDWMTENLAYDNYMTTVLKKTRMSSYNDYTGTWHVYNTHTGVCRDFVNIFAIMCRELGVPCGSLDSDNLNHTWSIVYLDGEWWEVDLTKDIKRHTYKEDINDISGTITVCYQYFLKLSPITNFDNVDYVNDDIVCASFRLTGECNNCIHTN